MTKIKNAIKVKSVNEEYNLVMAMHGVRNEHWTLLNQSLIQEDGKFYDKFEVKLQNGEIEVIYFDISSFYSL